MEEETDMKSLIQALGLVGVVGGTALPALPAHSECFTITRGPTYDSQWAQNNSLSTDTRALREYYPAQCGGNYLCDIVTYRIQSFNGEWSNDFFPGVNDYTNTNGKQRRVWLNFHDHTHAYTFCN